MRICFAVQSNHGEAIHDPEYCEKNPLGGTETAVVKMVQCLRALGADAMIATGRSQLPKEPVDVFISVRLWNVFLEGMRAGKLNYLWCQDDADQARLADLKKPAVAAEVCRNCDGLIMISHYQVARWMEAFATPPEKIFLSSNGIDLPRFRVDRGALAKRAPHAYYASTPFRGLAELLDFWPIVRGAVGLRAKLTICSSLKIYGDKEEPQYEALYEKARSLDGVEYLGSVGQERLREVSTSCRALAYPCTFPETGCIAAMEAMASGCVVVGTALGALPETAWRNPLVPIGNGWGDLWIEDLLRVMVNDRYYTMQAEENLKLAALMGWQSIAQKWLLRFQSDLVKKAWVEKAGTE